MQIFPVDWIAYTVPQKSYTLKAPRSNVIRKGSINWGHIRFWVNDDPVIGQLTLARNMIQNWVNLNSLFVKSAKAEYILGVF